MNDLAPPVEGEDEPSLIGMDAYRALERESARLREALMLADGSLTWCRARHQNSGHNGDVLNEAIAAVLVFTRARIDSLSPQEDTDEA